MGPRRAAAALSSGPPASSPPPAPLWSTLPHTVHSETGMTYVADTGNHRIQVFHPNGTFAFKFGSYGDGDGEFDSPSDIDEVSSAYVRLMAVADTGNHRIQVFHPNGTFAFKFGSYGDGYGEFDSPKGVHHPTAVS